MTISQQLRESRIAAGKEIEEVSEALNIRKKYLIALEEGDFDIIPGKVYVKGYLKLYARYLGVTLKSTKPNTLKQDLDLKNKTIIDKKYKNYLIILSVFMLILTVIVYELITSKQGSFY